MKHRNRVRWEDVRPVIKEKLIAIGITGCELKWQGCKGSAFPTLAHSLRRVEIGKYSGREQEKRMIEVIWACQHCHSKLDARKREDTYNIVCEVIKNRPKQITWDYELQ